MSIELTPSPAYAPRDDLDAIAAHEGERTLTWREWNRQADRLASSLARRGVQAGDRVAVRLHTRLEWLVISLALSKLDAAIVAVNYRLSPPEALYIASDCEVTAAIIDDVDPAELVDAWADLGLKVVVSVDVDSPGTELLSDLIEAGAEEDRPALRLAKIVIYSSGTTGAPKGAPMGEYINEVDDAVRLEYAMSVMFDGAAGGPGGATLINLPMHHGAGPSYSEFALATGNQVVFQRRFDAEDVLRLIERHRITNWIAVPTMLQRVLRLPAGVLAQYDLDSLRFILGGAAPFSSELKQDAARLFGDVIFEIYGATEAGMIAGATPELLSRKPTATGVPFRHVEVQILDEEGNVLGPGQTGEITVRTPNIIPGYIGRGPLGPDKLTEHGFYRTGDVGHLDEDGVLFIYDRLSDMIIAGGVNIYPAESEAVIGTHPSVAHVAVIGVPDPDHGEQPLAFVQTVPGASLTTDEVLAFCEGKLAKYKWPRAVEFVDELPMNSMGKVLKRVLRERGASTSGVSA
ncbi:fatty-acyl-CoA synthase [Nocardioides sp. OK12]|uniref:class I adenylate-forming enzyme family protein n=1 Tax=Nocardioides sp. OK12 TaxID=2758661 RepID=UPI0021C2FF7A|nr:class I adenylate-forming enzyme family protein [Nocardioides sp. OK12]GHJ61276.1 fatty-acyl-CoA synthase [Nocardioides sp. OK12]